MLEQGGRKQAWIPVGFWLVYALTRVGAALRGSALVTGNDDLARLVQVRQWMAGQSWFDLTQHRLNPPAGVAMHWTRHTDVLLGVLISVAGGPSLGAERFAVVALPLILALAVYGLIAALAYRVGGRSAVPASLLLLLASVLVAQQFAPGRIDHHGLQIVLLLISVLGLLRFEEPRWALLSGVAAGMSLSIGLEQLLTVAGIFVAVGWIGTRQEGIATSLHRFSGGVVATAVIGSGVFAPPTRLVSVACDVFSLPHVLAIGAGAATLALLQHYRHRVALLLGGGMTAALAALAVAPRCVDPYADVDPLLRRLWLANVAEAQGIVPILRDDPGYGLAVLIPGLLAFTYAITRWRRGGLGTGTWFRLTVVMAVGYGAALVQFRGSSVATALSVPVLGVVFARIRDRLAAWPMLGRVASMAVVALAISGLGPLVLGVAVGNGAGSRNEIEAEDCGVSDRGLVLEGVVLAPIDLGPDLLIGTEAGVVAAPYHRNNDGNRLAWELFMGSSDDADFTSHGIGWVVTCEGMNENGILTHEAPQGLLAALLGGAPPESLELTDLGGAGLTVYRVRG